MEGVKKFFLSAVYVFFFLDGTANNTNLDAETGGGLVYVLGTIVGGQRERERLLHHTAQPYG